MPPLSSTPSLLSPAAETRSTTLPTGVTLSYCEQGSPDGVPVLLLHGITDSLRSFDLVLPHLPASVRAIAVSQRGHGDSSRPLEGHRPRDIAADLAALLDALGVARAVVVGHSMGSVVAQRFALDHPERTLDLVLMGAFARVADHPAWQGIAEEAAGLPDPVPVDLIAAFQASTLAQPVSAEYFEVVVQESRKVSAHVWRAIAAGFRQEDHRAALGAVQAPTLAVWGDQDIYCSRADQDALLAAIPGARLLVYAGAGHALHWEQPARFAADLVAFVGRSR